MTSHNQIEDGFLLQWVFNVVANAMQGYIFGEKDKMKMTTFT